MLWAGRVAVRVGSGAPGDWQIRWEGDAKRRGRESQFWDGGAGQELSWGHILDVTFPEGFQVGCGGKEGGKPHCGVPSFCELLLDRKAREA